MARKEALRASIRSFRYGYLVCRIARKSDDFTTSPHLRPQDSSSPSGRRLTPGPLAWSDGRCVQEAGTYSPRDSDTRILGIPGSRGWVPTRDPNYDRVSRLTSPLGVVTHCPGHCSTRVAPPISRHTDLPWPPPSSVFVDGGPPSVPRQGRSPRLATRGGDLIRCST